MGRRVVGRGVMGSWDVGSWAWGWEANVPLFDLLPHSGKPVAAREALYGRKRDNGASLRLDKPSLSPELRPRPHSGARNRAQCCFQARGLRPHCRAFCQNTPDSVHSGPIATILAIFYGIQSTAGEARRYCNWIYSEYYLLLTCADVFLANTRAKISKKVLAFALGSL